MTNGSLMKVESIAFDLQCIKRYWSWKPILGFLGVPFYTGFTVHTVGNCYAKMNILHQNIKEEYALPIRKVDFKHI